MSLRWQSSSGGNEIRIFRDRIVAGILKISLWKGDAYGELNGYMLRFKNKGFWKNDTRILDIEGTKESGSISYNFWKGTASIIFEGERYLWQYRSWWKGSWRVSRGEEVIDFTTTGFWKSEGVVEMEGLSPALVLTGLFIQSHFARMAASAS